MRASNLFFFDSQYSQVSHASFPAVPALPETFPDMTTRPRRQTLQFLLSYPEVGPPTQNKPPPVHDQFFTGQTLLRVPSADSG